MPSAQTIHIIGLGVSSHEKEALPFSKSALAAMKSAELLIGSDRQLSVLENSLDTHALAHIKKQRLPKLSQLKEWITDCGFQKIVVLASGDPLYYGIGTWFSKNFAEENLHFYPAVSSIQAACHALGLSLQHIHVCTLHGRAVETLRTQMKRNRTLAVLSDQYSQPLRLAEECQNAGFGLSRLWVCENMGSPQQQIRCFSVSEILSDLQLEFDPLHITIIRLQGAGGVQVEFPGIPDAYYSTGKTPGQGMISKREVRLAILSLMQPSNEDIIWDVGAGCGGLAVELAYWNIEFRSTPLSSMKHDKNIWSLTSIISVW